MVALELSSRRILFEDADLIAVDKPAGLVSHATVDPKRDHLVAALTRYLEARGDRVPRLAQHHRLDRGTSGVVLFSKSPEIDRALGTAFAERRVHKQYFAVVGLESGQVFPGGQTLVDNYLAPGKGSQGRTTVVRSGGKPAQTLVTQVAKADSMALIEAVPKTGRTHQIRVHLAELGFPILGDTLYGGADPNTKRLLLHAHRVELEHPRTQAAVKIECPLPRAFVARFPDYR